ncbi:MAG: hypothetical protein P3W95_012740 [Tepidimonas taiwanensis]|nr:hypothetical protein [Tepidimonas taiwanensis]
MKPRTMPTPHPHVPIVATARADSAVAPPARAKRRLATAATVAAVLAATVAGCATVPADPVAAAEAAVRTRAQQRADAIVRGDAAAAYALAAPSYRRLVTPEVYATRRAAAPVQWKSARVHDVQCPLQDGLHPPVRCAVRLEVTSEPRLPLPASLRAPITGFVQETWVLSDGQWWVLEEL